MPQKHAPAAFLEWLKKQLTLAGEVVVCYEAGCFGYEPARRMQAMGAKVLVLGPQNWDEAGKRQVNDKFDARVMCQRLSEYLAGHRHALTVVRIPTREEEERRTVGRQRGQVRGVQRQLQAMGRRLLLRHEFALCGRWWRGGSWQRIQQELPAHVVAQLRHYVAVLEACETEALALEEELTAQTPAPELFHGEGALTHELLQRELADAYRFANPRQVGNYFGLCPSESTSADDRRLGSITKHGNPRLRCLMVELAWRVVFYQPGYHGLQKWAPIFALPKSTHSARKKKAIVGSPTHQPPLSLPPPRPSRGGSRSISGAWRPVAGPWRSWASRAKPCGPRPPARPPPRCKPAPFHDPALLLSDPPPTPTLP